MAQIIMLGTEGCGKTMLLTVLAQRYRSLSENGYFLEAMNGEANAFTNQNWHILKEQREWPPATPPGALRDFRWRLHTSFNNGNKLELVAADFAGEVFRAGFGRDDWSSTEAQQLKEYVSQSDALLLLINLRDLIDEQDIRRKSESEWALKNCLDYALAQGFRQLAVAFTQTDRYEAIFAECDGDDRTVLHRYLPQIFGSYPNIEVLRVAAVSGTTLDEDAEGLAIERPTENFGSVGIPELLAWVSKVQTRNKPRLVSPPPPLPDGAPVRQPQSIARWVLIAVALVVLVGVASSLKSCASDVIAPTVPKPEITAKQARFVGTGTFESYGIECSGRVVNNGAPGNVTIHVTFTQKGKTATQYKTEHLDHGEAVSFVFTDTKSFYQSDGDIVYNVSAD